MEVIFNPVANKYFSGEIEYRRVTKVLSMLKEPFDKKNISYQMAKKAIEPGVSVEEAQKKILEEWESMANNAIENGNMLHSVCEDFFTLGKTKPGHEKLTRKLSILMKDYKQVLSEDVIFLHHARLAGTTDLKCFRQSGKNSLVDYYDFKTNARNGILFDSVKRKNGELKHYNRMLLPPLSHLEDCNYNTYSLQLSLYAYMDEMEKGLKPGKLGILFIGKDLSLRFYPVPYMKLEAEKIIEFVMNIKPLPE